jgi:hypothetical protein
MAPMHENIKIIEENAEKVNGEMIALKADNLHWRASVTGLIEKHKKISPEEIRKVQLENSKLNQKLFLLGNQCKTLEGNLMAKNDDLQKTSKVKDQNSIIVNIGLYAFSQTKKIPKKVSKKNSRTFHNKNNNKNNKANGRPSLHKVDDNLECKFKKSF